MGGIWWPGSLPPSPLIPAPGLELRDTLSVTSPRLLFLFSSSRINESGSNKYKTFGPEREGGRKTQRGGGLVPFAPPGCEETQPPAQSFLSGGRNRRHPHRVEEESGSWTGGPEGRLQFTVVTRSLTGENGVGTCRNSCWTRRIQIPGRAGPAVAGNCLASCRPRPRGVRPSVHTGRRVGASHPTGVSSRHSWALCL